MKMRARLVPFVVVCVAACGVSIPGDASDRGGTIVIATASDADALFPPAALTVEARQATELIYEYLADAGPSMNTAGDDGFVKELASGWVWSPDSSRISFTINPRAKWQDGQPVTSRDVAFSYDVYKDPAVASGMEEDLADIDSVSTPDASTAVFWFARRTSHQFFNAASLMLILPEHLLGRIDRDSLRAVATRGKPVGSGRYRLGSWVKGAHFELDAIKDHYRGEAGPQRLIWSVTPEYRTAVTRLLGGEADVFANVRHETINDLAKKNFNVVSLPGMDYVFMQLNLRDQSGTRPHRLFASRDMRRAVTMALDRSSMVKNLFDTLASVSIGPTVRAFPSTDPAITQLPYDRAGAERILDSLGWKRLAPGRTRTRDGTPLRFSLLVPVSSMSRMRMAVMIQEQLKRVGVDVRVEQMDFSAFTTRQAARSFDAVLASWHVGSSPSGVRETWTTDAAKKGGLNYGSYSNPAFDKLVDSALSASSLPVERSYFRRAYQMIVDDAPAVWLYEPRSVMAIHKRIHITPMRPSAWWLDVGSWRIPASEQLERDKAPIPPDSLI
ncbi:MAG TPA: peptide ABC transporter substrate-binding protein [Gemmatimonadaceae bacterium]|nr:peptide ABC transporter substrate-binding protein [Gemmatimonadaceae bacterium]